MPHFGHLFSQLSPDWPRAPEPLRLLLILVSLCTGAEVLSQEGRDSEPTLLGTGGNGNQGGSVLERKENHDAFAVEGPLLPFHWERKKPQATDAGAAFMDKRLKPLEDTFQPANLHHSWWYKG